MKLIIDNNDGHGPQDYTAYVDGTQLPVVTRMLNRAARATATLVAADAAFVEPASGARVILERADGYRLFTGYLATAPQRQHVGYAQQGNAWRYGLVAVDDSWLLDRNALPVRPAFAYRTAGNALRTITNDVLPNGFDTSAVQEMGWVNQWDTNPFRSWSEHAQAVAAMMRGSYRAHDGKLSLVPIGQTSLTLDERDPTFSPEALTLVRPDLLRNDVTIVGELEPNLYVRDYFLGNGTALAFYLSQKPFAGKTVTVCQEDYLGPALSPTLWQVADPNHTVMVTGGQLRLNGPATVSFVEQVELAGGVRVQHGQVVFGGASSGTLGGVYNGDVSDATCVAGFRVTPNGSNCNLQALVNGTPTGPIITTNPTHQYALVTQLLANEAHRVHQPYFSSVHGTGSGRGGEALPAATRVVLSVHDVDPNNPGTIAAAATVLYDDVLWTTPPFGTYAVASGSDLHCSISFTRMQQVVGSEVRSMVPNQAARTRLTGALAEGGECYISSAGQLRFYPPYPPQANEQVVVAYRSSARAMARVQDLESIATHERGSDSGRRSMVKRLKLPPASTSVDCENAALALLDDSVQGAWIGEYRVVSDFLPATDVVPGMGIQIAAPSWGAAFTAVVHETDVQVVSLEGDRSEYKIKFANEAAQLVALEFGSTTVSEPLRDVFTAAGPSSSLYLAPLTAAQITNVIATEITVDAGVDPPSGGGFEVRRSDGGWGPTSDGNLVGRFATRSFTLPRLARVQDCYLRQYDASSPTKYSRDSALLHLDYPI